MEEKTNMEATGRVGCTAPAGCGGCAGGKGGGLGCACGRVEDGGAVAGGGCCGGVEFGPAPDGFTPPRTQEDLAAALELAMANPGYYERVVKWTYEMKPGLWYTLDRFVSPENMNLFRTCMCLLIANYGMNLEFSTNYDKIKKLSVFEPDVDKDALQYSMGPV